MPHICYLPKKFRYKTHVVIKQANEIITEFAGKGFDLTLRQLYYQFVARALLPNTQASYDRLGVIVSQARLAGLIDWSMILDRTRFLERQPTWGGPEDIISASASSFRVDMWERQEYHVEVWIEKDALKGVIEGVCNENRVSFFSCRGYVSQSAMWRAAQRFRGHDKQRVLLHLGDHDPSGIDMTRDIEDRLRMFGVDDLQVDRLALNMDQVREFNPPPNPTKMSDARAESYVAEFGHDSWELDALDPETISSLIDNAVSTYRDDKVWAEDVAREDRGRELLRQTHANWDAVTDFLENDDE